MGAGFAGSVGAKSTTQQIHNPRSAGRAEEAEFGLRSGTQGEGAKRIFRAELGVDDPVKPSTNEGWGRAKSGR